VTLRENFILDWVAPNGAESRTGVAIYDGQANCEGIFVAVLSERNEGMSVTNGIENIATALVAKRQLPPQGVVFVEHYPSEMRGGDGETFDIVDLAWHENRRAFSAPKWHPSDAAEVSRITGAEF